MPLIGTRLKEARTTRNYTQKQLAEVIQSTQQQIVKWESGLNDPSADTLVRLATALGCTTDWLLGLVEQPSDHLKLQDLSAEEWKLVDLYRRGALPELIIRLVTKLDKEQRWKAFLDEGEDQTQVSSR